MTTSEITEIRRKLVLHVDRIAGLIGPRTLSRPNTIKATTDYITTQWREMGFEVRCEEYEALGTTAVNLIVESPGTRRPEQIYLLGAHYDSVETTPGADDNASAIAVMLEVSRLLLNHPPGKTIRYVAFACEEHPYFNLGAMGSQYHATQARRRDEQIAGMLCLEMVGYFRNEPNSQAIPLSIPRILRPWLPTRGNFLAAVGNFKSWRLAWAFRRGFQRGVKFPLLSLVLPESVHEIRLSDNSSFWDQGYPALMLTDTSFLRNPHYHQPTDTPDTLDYDAMTQVTLGVANALRRMLR